MYMQTLLLLLLLVLSVSSAFVASIRHVKAWIPVQQVHDAPAATQAH
jgi:hypothetical protein